MRDPGDEHEHRELLEQATSGHAPALDRLVHRHLPGLRAFVRLHLGAELRAQESCSDLVQSVCRELVQRWDRLDYRGEAAFKGWLFTAARNKIRDRARYHAAGRRSPEREQGGDPELLEGYATVTTPSRAAASLEEIERIEAAFDRLSEDDREVISLARIVGLPHAEIAERMGRSVGAVRQLLGRALMRLGRELRRG